MGCDKPLTEEDQFVENDGYESFQSQLVDARESFGLAPDAPTASVTVAVASVDGEVVGFFASGQTGTAVSPMRDPSTGRSSMNAISQTHAEGRALLSLPGNLHGKQVTIIVDHDPCYACYTMFSSYADRLGVSLAVIGPTFCKRYGGGRRGK